MEKRKNLKVIHTKFVLVIVLILSLIMTSVSYAESILPYYVGVNRHMEIFEISNTGEATMQATMKPITSTVFDNVNIKMEVIRTKDLSCVYVNDWNVSYNIVADAFNKSTMYNVPAEGGYYMKVTYKCYKNNVLIETITTETPPDTYYM